MKRKVWFTFELDLIFLSIHCFWWSATDPAFISLVHGSRINFVSTHSNSSSNKGIQEDQAIDNDENTVLMNCLILVFKFFSVFGYKNGFDTINSELSRKYTVRVTIY